MNFDRRVTQDTRRRTQQKNIPKKEDIAHTKRSQRTIRTQDIAISHFYSERMMGRLYINTAGTTTCIQSSPLLLLAYSTILNTTDINSTITPNCYLTII
jgi:hypothetical protein